MNISRQRNLRPGGRSWTVSLVVALFAGSFAAGAGAQGGANKSKDPPARVAKPDAASALPADLDPEKVLGAIVKVSVHAIPGARSSANLGSEREGSGVLIGEKGLILTIGYLIVEADVVSVTDSKGRTQAAQVVGYDHATGFGLLRTITPFDAKPLVFGDSSKVAEREPVMIAGDDGVAFAYVVSKRAFSGNWEYALDQALYTSPPTSNWSGAALIDRNGKLLGVGSLIVRDATNEDPRIPGNMFVPIDLLKPILADLIQKGRRAGPARPWLGVAADEVQGRLVVTRVSSDGPADRAGVKVGDIILSVAGERVRTQQEFYQRVWSRGGAGVEIPVRLLQGVDVSDVGITSIDRIEYFKPRTTY